MYKQRDVEVLWSKYEGLLNKLKAYDEILENHELYIYPRKISAPIPNYFINHPKIYWMNAPLIDASSTDIRNKIKNKKSISNLVPKNVCYSILEKKLYI